MLYNIEIRYYINDENNILDQQIINKIVDLIKTQNFDEFILFRENNNYDQFNGLNKTNHNIYYAMQYLPWVAYIYLNGEGIGNIQIINKNGFNLITSIWLNQGNENKLLYTISDNINLECSIIYIINNISKNITNEDLKQIIDFIQHYDANQLAQLIIKYNQIENMYGAIPDTADIIYDNENIGEIGIIDINENGIVDLTNYDWEHAIYKNIGMQFINEIRINL